MCLLGSAGYNVCIFAYGQTGSGKTHTMAGTNIEQYAGRGINYRALDDLFALNAKRQGEVSQIPAISRVPSLHCKHWCICSRPAGRVLYFTAGGLCLCLAKSAKLCTMLLRGSMAPAAAPTQSSKLQAP